MKYFSDLHTHSIISGHAYSTIQENVKMAVEKGMFLIGLSEHGPKMPNSAGRIYFQNLRVMPRTMYGIEVRYGIELNIIDYNGNVDLDEDTLDELDYSIASMHPPCIGYGSVEENTRAIIGAIKNPYVKIIGHPDDERYLVDYDEVAKMAKDYGVLLEVNNSSLSPNSFRMNTKECYYKMFEACVKYDTQVIVNSDAHVSFDVGNEQYALGIIEEAGFPDRLIINNQKEKIFDFLDKK